LATRRARAREEADSAQVQARRRDGLAKRSKTFGEFMAVKKPAAGKKAAKKFKGVRREKTAAKK
jgi:hypothetical protein